MADIKVISTGRQFFQVDGTLAAILLEMFPAAVERITQNPAPPAPVSAVARFYVGKNHRSDKVALCFENGNEQQWFEGPAEHAHRAFGKRQVPADVIAQYADALKQEEKNNLARHLAMNR